MAMTKTQQQAMREAMNTIEVQRKRIATLNDGTGLLDALREELQAANFEYQWAVDKYVEDANSIAQQLLSSANALYERDLPPNSLGVLQSNASGLNALCGKIDAIRSTRARLRDRIAKLEEGKV